MQEQAPAAEVVPTMPSVDEKPAGSIKETIESILVAFILAFIFRVFVVEAFVIPTGSMATTLLGAHTRFECAECGYRFDVNYSSPSSNSEDEDYIPPTAGKLDEYYCPNCGTAVSKEQLTNPPVYYGDRILVLKYLYLLQDPKRWDVVVFKAPIKMDTNYIKRLIGTPGEAVMILDGDVYIRPVDAKNPDDFVIQTKPDQVQQAMWRLVYDNDFHPRGGNLNWVQPWQVTGGLGWNTSDAASHGRIFHFQNAVAGARLSFNPAANPTAQSLSDYLVYDQQSPQGQVGKRPTVSQYPFDPTRIDNQQEIPVSDIDLRLTYQRQTGGGPLQLVATKRNYIFTAEITPTQATLFEDKIGQPRKTIGTAPIPSGSGPLQLELTNADYRATLRVNDAVVAQTTPAQYAPDIPALMAEYDMSRTPPPPRIEITAEAQTCDVSHVSLWRDQFYYNNKDHGFLRAVPHAPVELKKGEYFVMGDNSILSYDGRCWPTRVDLPDEGIACDAGKVPERFMLGKAFYVYWPAGYPLKGIAPIIPNFASMRFIH